MAEPDPFYVAAERRIERLTLAFGIIGALFAFARWGWRSGVGLALGAGLMWLNFRWLKQGIGALVKVSAAQASQERVRVPRSIYAKFFGRFALLLIAVYVILSRTWLPVPAVIVGLFAVVAAVMAELVWELVTGGLGTETHS